MPIARAGTLIIPSGPSHNPDKPHLFVICNDTDADGQNLIVPITSWTNDLCDDTCRLDHHEHKYLQHRSFVLYRKARIEPAKALLNGLASGKLKTSVSMNEQAFLKVRNGVCRSPQTPRKVKVYFGCP